MAVRLRQRFGENPLANAAEQHLNRRTDIQDNGSEYGDRNTQGYQLHKPRP